MTRAGGTLTSLLIFLTLHGSSRHQDRFIHLHPTLAPRGGSKTASAALLLAAVRAKSTLRGCCCFPFLGATSTLPASTASTIFTEIMPHRVITDRGFHTGAGALWDSEVKFTSFL